MNNISMKQVAMIATLSKSIVEDARQMVIANGEGKSVDHLRIRIGDYVDKIIAARGCCCSKDQVYLDKAT